MMNVNAMFVINQRDIIHKLKLSIDWESLNIYVAESTSSSIKAIKVFKKHLPDILFVELELPIRDGIELSEEILELNPMTRIILIAKKSSFDDMRRAINMDIEYFLMENEIDKLDMFQIMNKIVKKVHQQNNHLTEVRQSKLRTLFDSGEEVDVQQYNEFEKYNVPKLLMMVFQVETPYEFWNTRINESQTIVKMNDIKSLTVDITTDIIDYIQLNSKTWMVLFDASSKSTNQCTYLIQSICKITREYFYKQFQQSISLVYIMNSDGKGGLRTNYLKCLKSIEYRVFNGVSFTAEANGVLAKVNDFPIKTRPELTSIFDAIRSNEYETIEYYVDKMFRETYENDWNLAALQKVCRRLVNVIDYFRVEQGLETIEEQMVRKDIDISKLYSIDAIKNWFLKRFRSIIKQVHSEPRSKWSRSIIKAVGLIEKHYAEDISLVEVAKQLGLSEVYLSKLFKQETGYNFLEYLTNCRMFHARKLLKYSDEKIYIIAVKVGYHSSRYFSRVFFKETGILPKDFRRKNSN